MQDKHLFEYAVLRVVPRVEREEFLNVGVIVFCKKQRYLQAKFFLDKERVQAFCKTLDCEDLEEHLKAFERISQGDKEGGPIAQLDTASRFRWLTATRSTILQSSKVHPGFTADLDVALNKLFIELVL
jgi:hypothetical protein